MDIEIALRLPAVQSVLPDLLGIRTTVGYDWFLTNLPDTVTSNPQEVRSNLRRFAVQLERHERLSVMWKHQYENQLLSLRQIIQAYDIRCDEIMRLKGFAKDCNLHQLSSSERTSIYQLLLGQTEFEDLYYFIACKTRSLYQDLQLRFSSGFLTMESKMHDNGTSSFDEKVDCRVKDIRNLLRAIWYHLIHPTIVGAIEAAINHRKYQALKSNPLVPSCNARDLIDDERYEIEAYRNGLNLDAPVIGRMFDNLDDVSKMSIPAMLLKISRRTLGSQYISSSQNTSANNSLGASSQHSFDMVIDIKEEDEEYIQKQINMVEEGYKTLRQTSYSSPDASQGNTIEKLRHGDAQHRAVRRLSPLCRPLGHQILYSLGDESRTALSVESSGSLQHARRDARPLPLDLHGNSALPPGYQNQLRGGYKLQMASPQSHNDPRAELRNGLGIINHAQSPSKSAAGDRGRSPPRRPERPHRLQTLEDGQDLSDAHLGTFQSPGLRSERMCMFAKNPFTAVEEGARNHAHALRTPEPTTPLRSTAQNWLPSSAAPPSTARKNVHFADSEKNLGLGPSHYHRMPFFREAKPVHKPPTPPPKPPGLSPAVRNPKATMQAEIEELRRDNSKLQAIMDRNYTLQMQNNELQEQLDEASTPKGLFRRLSQLGTRTRSRSPVKITPSKTDKSPKTKKSKRKSESDAVFRVQ